MGGESIGGHLVRSLEAAEKTLKADVATKTGADLDAGADALLEELERLLDIIAPALPKE